MSSAREFPVEQCTRMPLRRGRSARASGFTLIELLIAMVVLGILTAIALPLYSEFVMRSRIVDATSSMNDYRIRMEQNFQDRRDYGDGAAACGVVPPAPTNFTLTCVPGPGALSYVLTAQGGASMANFTYNLTVNAAGVLRTTVAVQPGWALPAPNTCWAVRKNGYCS